MSRRSQSLRKKTSRLLRFEMFEKRRCMASDFWANDGGDVGHDGYVNTEFNARELRQVWSIQTPLNTSDSYRLPVAMDDQFIYQTIALPGSTAGGYKTFRVVAMSQTNGEEIWSTEVQSYDYSVTAPTIDNGVIYVNSAGHSQGLILNPSDPRNPRIYGLSAATGQILFSIPYAKQWGREIVRTSRVISLLLRQGTMGALVLTTHKLAEPMEFGKWAYTRWEFGRRFELCLRFQELCLQSKLRGVDLHSQSVERNTWAIDRLSIWTCNQRNLSWSGCIGWD